MSYSVYGGSTSSNYSSNTSPNYSYMGPSWAQNSGDEGGDDKMVPNLKRPAMKKVLDALDDACDDLDAGPTSGMMPKSDMLTEGLGGDGKIWQTKPLADNYRTEIKGIIDRITSKVSTVRDDVSDDHAKEPEQVKKSDRRAKWGL
ncbi:MAG: hypothetical protein Q4E00_03180 [Actinomyces bowdenii]|nr:hypothetical protein [Actinomyces bowdenii]